jgi:UDP-glucose 4-epimerase
MSSSYKRYLVTGGAGFIGSNMVEALLERKARVRVLDNFSTGLIDNLKPFLGDVELFRGDLRDPKAVRRAVKGVRGVYHMAAIRAVHRSCDDPAETNEVNLSGTLNLLVAARDAGVKRVIYSSSSAVYGDSRRFPLSESHTPVPVSPYGASKLGAEYYCRIFSRLYGVETVSLRYFNVFGPRQNPESQYSTVIPIFIYRLLKNRSPEIHWDGRQSRDFHYVDSVVRANLRAMETPAANGGVFNIASEEEHSVLEIFRELKKIMAKPAVRPRFFPKRPGDVRRTNADIARAKKILGYRVKTRFAEGLKKTVEWFLESRVLEKIRL